MFLGSVFSRIRTEYGYLFCKSSYSLQKWKNTERKKLHIFKLSKKKIFFKKNEEQEIFCILHT